MRHDYLYNMLIRYGEGGFKRLMKGGFMMQNMAIYHYIPTLQAQVMHQSITGTKLRHQTSSAMDGM